ncbi:phage portal protein [Rhodococcus ruber]
MVAFQSLGALSEYLAARPAVEVVDAGVPLGDLVEVNAENVLRNQPSVRKVVNFIARNVASVPLHLFERISDTDRERVTDHVLAEVLGQPAPKVTPYRFWRDVMIDQLIHDRYCVLFTETDTGLTLTRLPAKRVRFKADPDLGVMQTVRFRRSDGEVVEFEPDQCIYDVGYSPRGANGLSPIETLREILAESLEAVEYRRSVWKNGARIPQVIERPKDTAWTDTARERFVNDMANFRKGGGKEGKMPVLEDGMQIKEVTSFRPRDTLDLEGRKLTDAEVASAYFIAPELVGAREGTYSNVDAFRQMLYRDSLGPWLFALEQSLNTHLTPVYAGGRRLYIEYNLDAKLRGSFEEQNKVLRSAIGAPYLTRNEGRARLNLPAIDGGDELVVPLNVVQDENEGRPPADDPDSNEGDETP